MAKFEVTLTGNVRVNKQNCKAGEKIGVDENLLVELQKHGIVTDVIELPEESLDLQLDEQKQVESTNDDVESVVEEPKTTKKAPAKRAAAKKQEDAPKEGE